MSENNDTLLGTASGTFLSLLPNLHSHDIFKTIVLASIGAIVSFVISYILKIFIKKQKK